LTTDIHILSLHDALPISGELEDARLEMINNVISSDKKDFSKEDPLEPKLTENQKQKALDRLMLTAIFNHFFTMTAKQKELFLHEDRKSTRLNSSHVSISY